MKNYDELKGRLKTSKSLLDIINTIFSGPSLKISSPNANYTALIIGFNHTIVVNEYKYTLPPHVVLGIKTALEDLKHFLQDINDESASLVAAVEDLLEKSNNG